MSDVAVSVQGLGKRYRIAHRRESYGRLTESLTEALRTPMDRIRRKPRQTSEWIWALRDISFELRFGEVVGVIGSNGAGKSTLLKVLSRITEPTLGTATLRGRVASMLEVGTGFHPELTGRENIYLSGAVLGMQRAEIARKFDEIVDFSGVEQFLDTPAKRYSSGMQVRLGFAVAAHLDPEILFIDEVLAVGDLAFQEKCLGKMNEVAGQGRTVVFVSHNMGAIGTLCPTTIWLHQGTVRGLGSTADVVPAYVRSSGHDPAAGELLIEAEGDREALVKRVRILAGGSGVGTVGECSDEVAVEFVLQIRRRVPGLYAWLDLRLPDGTVVLMSDSYDTEPNPLDDLPVGEHLVTVRIPPRALAPGTYDVYLNLTSQSADDFNVHSPGVVGTVRLHDSRTLRGDARPGYSGALMDWQVAPGSIGQRELGTGLSSAATEPEA